MHSRLQPKLITVLREGYTKKQGAADLVAGVIVGIVALPLAIAFAIASGVKPEQGLYTAIIAGLVIGALGGSRAQISGPTGAFIVIIYGIVQQYGYDGLAIATIIAGFILIVMGLMRMGAFLKFIPFPVTVGFTTGIALIIFSGQIRDFFGLKMTNVPADFVEKWAAYFHHFSTVSWQALVVGALSLLIVFLWPRVTPRIPGSLIAIIVATVAVRLLDLNVETIGSRFGGVPNMLPAPHFPHLTWGLITKMFSPAITIALLAAIESLLAAVVADGMMGARHRSNMELIAQGVANIISPVFQGIPATGAIARTATNIKSGGRTPFAAIIHAITLLLIMLFFGRWAALIPMPALAAILIFVAYNMSEYHAFLKLLRSPKSDVAVLLVTFFLTVLIDLTVAIQVGVVLAAFLFMKRMSEVAQVNSITDDVKEEEEEEDNPRAISKRVIPPGVEVFEVFGSLFFGAIERFKDAMRRVGKAPKVLIIRMRMVPAVDATGLQALEDALERTRREGGTLMLTGVAEQPLRAMEQSGFLKRLGRENVMENIDEALRRAREILEPPA
ncbi:MAG: C4-dicarboxylic acid transporter DauA [Acidobacteria bacterium]|nr:C4-dicarboxylic acid transporter DauA [Acidobacteriota bacterium]